MHSPPKINKFPRTFGSNLTKNTFLGTNFKSYMALSTTNDFKIALGSSDIKRGTFFNNSSSTDPSAFSLKPCDDSEKALLYSLLPPTNLAPFISISPFKDVMYEFRCSLNSQTGPSTHKPHCLNFSSSWVVANGKRLTV